MVSRHGSFASLDDWLAWLETLSPREIELGLDRVRDVLARMDLPRPKLVIHVGGTNGKGSTVAMLEALFLKSGARVASYSSPHVRRYNERMRVQGRELDDEAIVSSFRAVEVARRNVILTYFEFGTLAAFSAFAKAGAEVLLLEIGLGGRLDAVNAIDPDAAIITNVTLDHCEWLGPDTETIACEKAGIMRHAIPVIFGSPEVPSTIRSEAARRHADLRLPGRDYRSEADDESWRWRGRERRLDGLLQPGLLGAFQVQNAAAVLALIESLNLADMLSAGFVNAAWRDLTLRGRLQAIDSNHRHWLLDVAHNPDAARVLGETLRDTKDDRRLVGVFGVLADKDIDGILRCLCPVIDRWIAVPAGNARAMSAQALAATIANTCNQPCRIAASIAEGLDLAAALSEDNDTILVTGSFYTVGPVLEILDPQT